MSEAMTSDDILDFLADSAVREATEDQIAHLAARCDALTAENDTYRKCADAAENTAAFAFEKLEQAEAEVTRLSALVAVKDEALEIIAGRRRGVDSLMSNIDIANAALSESTPKADAIMRVVEAARELFATSKNEMVSRGLPLEWQADSAMGRMDAALASLDQSEGK
jgi:hypothetical protein